MIFPKDFPKRAERGLKGDFLLRGADKAEESSPFPHQPQATSLITEAQSASTSGSWRECATRTPDYSEARRIRIRFLADQKHRRVATEQSKWTLQQAVDQRLINLKHRIARSSLASEASIMRTLLRLLGSGTRLGELADINAIRKDETDRIQEGVSVRFSRSIWKVGRAGANGLTFRVANHPAGTHIN